MKSGTHTYSLASYPKELTLDGDGKKTGGKACESGRYPCDGTRKVSTVGHLGGRA